MLWSVSGRVRPRPRAPGGWLLRMVMLPVCALMLGGCASGLYANVTSYQKWPADAAGQTYRIVPDADQSADNLAFQAVADMVRANIGSTGLIEAVAGATPGKTAEQAAEQITADVARFSVYLHYENPETQIWTQRYADTFYPWGWPYYYSRHYGWNDMYAPPLVTVPVQVYRNTLTLWIRDKQKNDAEVYRATAIQIGENDHLIAVMPYLAQVIFDGFPGNNGQVRQVRYDLTK